MRQRHARAGSLAGATALFLALGASVALADGPVDGGDLPGGGANVTDTDTTGTGERWGRTGGRTITYEIVDPTSFSSLSWGAVGANPASLAFDNSVDAAGEILTLNLGLSDLPNGIAVWTGNAVLPLVANPSLNLPTRFTLTIDNGFGGPVPLTSTPGGNDPGVDVLAAGGTVRANMLFEANHNGSFGVPSGWRPVLTLFDDTRLPTFPSNPPGTSGPVLTAFSRGFFFEESGGGGTDLDLDEHDANMFSQTNMIKTDLAFLTTDAINRLQLLNNGQQETRDWMSARTENVLEAINQLPNMFPEIPEFPELPGDISTTDDVHELQDGLTEILLLLFGLTPCPDDAGCTPGEPLQLFATPDDVQAVADDIADALNTLAEIQAAMAPEISVQVVNTSSDSLGRYHRWLLTTTVAGQLVDASLVRVVAVTASGLVPASTEDVTLQAVPVSLGPGMLDVLVTVPSHLRNASAFQLDLFFDDGTTTALGSALVTGNSRR